MPLPKVMYQLDQYHNGQFIVVKMVNGEPDGEIGRSWDVDEAKKIALDAQIGHVIWHLFPESQNPEVQKLTEATQEYFAKLLRTLPDNGDANQARLLVRQAFNFARSAILLDGMV